MYANRKKALLKSLSIPYTYLYYTTAAWQCGLGSFYFSDGRVFLMVTGAIVAGGTGSRMGKDIPKQFLDAAGKPIIIHTIGKFLACPDIDNIVVGVHPEWTDYLEDLCGKYFEGSPRILITAGGASRNDTIVRIIEKAKENFDVDDETVFVTHDAVRPFVSPDIIKENIRAAEEYGICGTVIPATDTITRSADGEFITDIPLRSEMYRTQTPQSFRYGLFKNIYASLSEEELESATDICRLFFLRGCKIKLVEGSPSNFKITYPTDLKMADILLEK